MAARLVETYAPDYQKAPTKAGTIGQYRVACVNCGPREAEAGAVLGEVIPALRPRWILLVGIAGGFPEERVRRGDVVIARHVYGFTGKIDKGGTLRRPDLDFGPDPVLLSHARAYSATDPSWRKTIEATRPGRATSRANVVRFGYDVSLDFVLDDPSHSIIKEIRPTMPELHSVEMEAAGIGVHVRRVQADRQLGFMMVRGVSDEVGKGSGSKQRDLWKTYASDAAAAFIEGFLEYLPDLRSPEASTSSGPPASVVARPLDSVRVDTPTGPRPPPHELPPPAVKFLGREPERRELIERLRSSQNTAVVGPAGLGKTALAAAAIREVSGDDVTPATGSPFPDGVVFLDLYLFQGDADRAWNSLANQFAGPEFMEQATARERAEEACRSRRALIIFEGGEEADGTGDRATFPQLRGVLSSQNRWLLLTRDVTQANRAQTIPLKETLGPNVAGELLDSLTTHLDIPADMRQRVLDLLEGHPLALTWAGGLLGRGDEDPSVLVDTWEDRQLPSLSDPEQAHHTLRWLFDRSVRALDEPARQCLVAAGLLARQPFPLSAIRAALTSADSLSEDQVREPLRKLVQRGLLQRAEASDHWTFTHSLGYGYAREELNPEETVRERLAVWTREQIGSGLSRSGDTDALRSVTSSLQHANALLGTDGDQRLWVHLASPILYEVRDQLVSLGLLTMVDLALGAVAGWWKRIPSEEAEKEEWRRERSVLSNRLGDLLVSQGDGEGALSVYRESLAIAERLAAQDPSNAVWQTDVVAGRIRIVGLADEHDEEAPTAAIELLKSNLEVLRLLQEQGRLKAAQAGWVADHEQRIARLEQGPGRDQ